MRVAFIADIHGNGVALDAVLEDIEKRKVDRIAVLGDITFRGPEPKRVLELLVREHPNVPNYAAELKLTSDLLGEIGEQ